jgi:methylenetetrahydrofolate reductase (NADPH)
VTLRPCPKHMTYGPCGGVAADGSCEVDPLPCPFVGRPVVRWPGAGPDEVVSAEGRELLEIAARRPLVVSQLPAAPLDIASLDECADVLRGATDAVLTGDAATARVQFPPAYRTHLARQRGLRVWAGLNCRDRNRVALEAELAALAHAGAAAVHCVTGDHPASGGRPDAAPVFDLEGTTLVPRARALGLLTSVAESPSAPPVGLRPRRLAEKVRAGAQAVLLQYCGEADDVAAFVAASHAEGADVPVLPGVPVVVDRAGAELVASFAAAVLPAGFLASVLDARDPFTAGMQAALRCARDLIGVPGVTGVVLAGGAAVGNEPLLARAIAEVGRALGAGT